MAIDLHIHSTISDGSLSPSEIVKLAARKGLKAIAITDHDSVDGVEEELFTSRDENLNIEIVTGLELSVKQKDTNIHLLGYMFNHKDTALLGALEQIQKARSERNEEIIEKLTKLGITVDISILKGIAGPGQLGRPHLAKLLIQLKAVKNMAEAFERYLGCGAIAYVPRKVYSAHEAIDIIQRSGGLSFLAHPYFFEKNGKTLEKLLAGLKEIGLDGVETYYPTHSKQFRNRLFGYAEKYSLLLSGGSDYHGDIRPGTHLAGGKNVTVPEIVLKNMKRYQRKRS